MKLTIAALALAVTITGMPAVGAAAEVVRGDKFDLDINGRLQWLGVAQRVDDDFRNDERLYLFMKQARLRFDGRYEDVKFDIQWAYGGEETVAASPGVSLSLLDFNFDVPVVAGTRLKVGQFRVPYGRERITDAGTLNFADRSIQALGFSWNRDVGVALHTTRGRFMGTAGVFTGGGRDVPQRYLPEIIGTPMFVARAGYNDGMDDDVFEVRARADRPKKAVAAYVNGLYIKDSLIGHSTVLNVRSSDKSLLVNSNWNPFIARSPLVRGRVWQAGGDVAMSAPVGSWTATAEAEANYASFSNDYGNLSLKGGRLQVGASRGRLGVSVRYAVLYPDTRMANTFTPAGGTPQNANFITTDAPFRELTPSLTYRYRSSVAVVADLRFLSDMLVISENRIGTYVASEQPDQVTVIRPAVGFKRDTVIDARLMLQFTF